MNTPQTTPIQSDYKVWVNQKSPFKVASNIVDISEGERDHFCFTNKNLSSSCFGEKYSSHSLGSM